MDVLIVYYIGTYIETSMVQRLELSVGGGEGYSQEEGSILHVLQICIGKFWSGGWNKNKFFKIVQSGLRSKFNIILIMIYGSIASLTYFQTDGLF